MLSPAAPVAVFAAKPTKVSAKHGSRAHLGARLRIWLSGACIAVTAPLCAAFSAAPSRLDYVMSPVMENGALRGLAFELDFRGDADGETILQLPEATSAENVVGTVSLSGAEIKESAAPTLRVLRHRPNARIRLSWLVIHDWPDAPTGLEGDPYRPVIQPTYFQVLGPAAMIVPQVDEGTAARFRMRGFPRAWSLASDLERPGLTQKGLYYSVFVGGDYRVLRGARDPNQRLAIRGAWTFQDEDLLRDLEPILEAQRRFWGDPSRPYLVTVTPLPSIPHMAIFGGSNVGDAFAYFATPNVELKLLTHSLAHEGQHTWIPFELGLISEVDEAASYWFSEGFTDFFAPRLLVRDRIWGAREFTDDLNEMLRAYAASPARTATNARIVEARQKDPIVEALPYQRGRLFATLIDARLRARGRDLDDVVLEMRRRAPSAGMFAPALFTAVMTDMGMPVEEDIRAFIERGEPILLPEDTFAPCGRVVTRGVQQELVLDQNLDAAQGAACLRVLAGA